MIRIISELGTTQIEPQKVEEIYLHSLLSPVSDSSPVKSHKEEVLSVSKNLEIRQTPFVCQLLRVSALKFALPLSTFSQVIPWLELKINEVNKGACLIGQVESDKQIIDVIDLVSLVVPKSRQMNFPATINKSLAGIILLQEGSRGLAYDELLELVTIEPKTVCWRSTSSEHPWLAGTVKRDGYALLDVDGIQHFINEKTQREQLGKSYD